MIEVVSKSIAQHESVPDTLVVISEKQRSFVCKNREIWRPTKGGIILPDFNFREKKPERWRRDATARPESCAGRAVGVTSSFGIFWVCICCVEKSEKRMQREYHIASTVSLESRRVRQPNNQYITCTMTANWQGLLTHLWRSKQGSTYISFHRAI